MRFCDERIQKHLLNGGKIKRVSKNKGWDYRPIVLDDELLKFTDNGDDYIITKRDLTSNGWEVVEPEYNWDKIIKDKILCVFSDNKDFKYLFYTGLLQEFNNKNSLPFKEKDGVEFHYCKPFNPADFNIAKDLKEYEK